MRQPNEGKHRALLAKFIWFCEKYGIEPIEAIDMLEVIWRKEAIDCDEKAHALRQWAIAVCNSEPWALELCA